MDSYPGVAVEPVLLPSHLWAAALSKVAGTVPDVVTGELGVEDNTVPSPVKVTLVTVPVPVAGVHDKFPLPSFVNAPDACAPGMNTL